MISDTSANCFRFSHQNLDYKFALNPWLLKNRPKQKEAPTSFSSTDAAWLMLSWIVKHIILEYPIVS